ncbi:unnamed protein product [Brachionus calyciflorus]|uniref:Tropomyosin n=1 Tax=Brachionus calyciflorus TaxID=104777 RepID=A0A814I1P3_9BILA|nr:unnamed protein product [Brachionus calyciflorus]
MATPTMDSIKKKMQAMKLEKENAIDRADQMEQKTKDLEDKLKLAEEENTGLMKRISQLDTDLDKAQETLAEVNGKLEAANKTSADVSSRETLIFFKTNFILKIESVITIKP